ncbi:MAG: BTAD domain-containing putative transcriptional regulator [Pseudomonadota bacterium]
MTEDTFIPEAKYTFPESGDAIPRERLFALMRDYDKKSVILVTGQAAQGKSTLVASFLRLEGDLTAWIHLDQEDSDPANLFCLLITALKTSIPALEDILSPGYSQPSLGPGQEIWRYRDVLRNAFHVPELRFTIVMDDLDSLNRDASSFELIQGIVEDLPPSIRLIVLSRTLPPLGIQKLKIAGKLLVLTNSDLAFTLEETRLLFRNRLKSMTISPEEIERLHAITDGWAGGLILLAESIRHTLDVTRLPEKLKVEALDYFAEEVFSVQPESIKRFLVLASLFDPMDPEIIARFYQELSPLDILNELERRNLFIHRLDSRTSSPVFRFNKLFRSFLLSLLKANVTGEEFRSLSIRAGEIYDQKKQFDTALKYYIQAGDQQKTAELIIKTGTDLILTGRLTDLSYYISTLPDPVIWRNPWLIYFLTMTRRIRGGKRNIEDFTIALTLFREQGNTRGVMLATAHLIEAAVFLQKPPDIIRQWILQAEATLVSIREQTLFSYARTVLWLHIGLGYIAGTGDVAKGISACKNAQILADMIHNPGLKFNALIVSTLGFVRAGDVERAEHELGRIANPSEKFMYPEYRTLNNMVRIELLLKKGDLDEAGLRIGELEKDIETFGLLFQYPGLVEARAMFHLYNGDMDRALQDADHLSDISILAGNTYYLGLAHRIRAMGLYHKKDYLKAEIEAQRALEIFSGKQDDRQFYLSKMLYGMILMHRKKLDAAEAELGRVLDYLTRFSSQAFLSETRCALGLVLWKQNRKPEALDNIRLGMDYILEEGHHHFSAMSPMDFTRAFLLDTVSGSGPVSGHAIALLSGKLSGHIGYDIQVMLSDVHFQKKRSWTSRLKELFRYTLPKIRVETLGEFRVFSTTAGDIQWEGTRPRLLFKSIITHGGSDIPKDILIEDLWPETSEASGEKKFRVTLHRLRKTLEPLANKEFGYAYIKLESGYVSVDTDLVSIDCYDFHTLYVQGLQSQSRGHAEKAKDMFEKAALMYKGDFLSEEPYVDWAVQKRDELVRIHRDLLDRMASLHEQSGNFAAASRYLLDLVQADPCLESAYRKLMHLYCTMGMKNSALRIFEECRTVIKKELGCEPDTDTVELYEAIRNTGGMQ